MCEEKGFHAIALIADTQIFGKRRTAARNNFLPKVELEVFKELGVNVKFIAEDPK